MRIALTVAPNLVLRRAAFGVIALMTIVSCSGDGSTAPSGSTSQLPGKRLLPFSAYQAWAWYPAGGEIVYTTRIDFTAGAPPIRIEAISISTGQVRTVVGIGGALGIRATEVWVYGSYVYFTAIDGSSGASLFRASLSGVATPEKLADYPAQTIGEFAPSPDGRTIAWPIVENQLPLIVTVDIATRAQHRYPLQTAATRVRWSPSGHSILAVAAPYQLLDIDRGVVKALATVQAPEEIIADFGPRANNLEWNGEAPVVYAAQGRSANRYVLTTGNVEQLTSLPRLGSVVGWSADFTSAVVASTQCDKYSTGPFGGDCIQWTLSADRIDLRSGATANGMRITSRDETYVHADPTMTWLASVYYSHTMDDGLYILPLPSAR